MEDIKPKQINIIEFDVADFYPKSIEIFDLKPFLFQGIALKEKDFRKDIKQVEWIAYKGKILKMVIKQIHANNFSQIWFQMVGDKD